jgi:hypothetical protein
LSDNARKDPESLDGFQEKEPITLGDITWIGQDEDENEK